MASSRSNPEIPENLSSCQVVKIDLQELKSLESSCEGVAGIIHLAALDASGSQETPEEALLINSLGTLNLLKAAEKSKVHKFIYLSTVHIYGSPLQGYIDESSLPRPLHHYSITHKTAEDYVIEAQNRTDISSTIFRLSNAVGSPESPQCNFEISCK